MSVSAVDTAIRKIREVVKEWDAVGLNYWREDHTRYGVIDPIIRELGWDTSDPKECHPEYPRPYREGRVDYALFGTPDVESIGNNCVPADVVIESKALREPLDDEEISQLQGYVEASPRMRNGVAVLTNGNEWCVYDLTKRGSFKTSLVEQVNILSGSWRASGPGLELLAGAGWVRLRLPSRGWS